MKKIYIAILAVSATFLFAQTLSAQRDVPYHEKGGVGYNKYTTSDKPDRNGEYTIRLETFTTGEVHVEKRSIPSDIVLVLDMSGSMNYEYKLSAASLADQLAQDTSNASDGSVQYTYKQAKQVTNGYSSINGSAANVTAFSNNYSRYYLHTDGNFYQVKQEHGSSETIWSLYVNLPEGKRYLHGNSTDDDGGLKVDRPTDITADTQVIWTGILWRYPSRIEKLKSSVNTFIDMIAQNDADEVQPYLEYGVKGNQISIVRFTGTDFPVTELRFNDDGTVKEGAISDWSTGSYVAKRFTTVNSTTNVAALHTAMNNMKASGETPHDAGMRLAQLLLQDLEDKGMPAIHPTYNTTARLKTVVFFTDGQPSYSGAGRNAYQGTHDATVSARIIKRDAPDNPLWADWDSGYALHGKIFSIGFNADSYQNVMRYISSQYPDGLEVNTSGSYAWSGHADTEHVDENGQTIYYKDAAVSDLSAVFESIAEYAGGNNQEYGATSMVSVDIVSSSFQLPEGVDLTRVKVYTAQCLGILDETFTPEGESTPKNYLAFAAPIEAPNRAPLANLWVSHKVWKVDDEGHYVLDGDGNKIQATDDDGNPIFSWEEETNVDIDGTAVGDATNENGLRITVNPTDNSVSITGFDFAKCWCGLDAEHENAEQYTSTDPNYSHHVAGYRGFKLIIEFPIKVTSDAVGGPAVNTNLPGSGLYMTDANGNKIGEPIVTYPAPTLIVPVNIWIQKKGLKKGESATFTLERKLAQKVNETDPEPTWGYFTKVMVTGQPGNDPVEVRLLNIDPSYYYRIVEDGWSWSYTKEKDDEGVLKTEDGKLASTEVNTHNPIVIVNTKKDETPKHAESVVNNNFSNNQAVTTSSKDHTYTTTP